MAVVVGRKLTALLEAQGDGQSQHLADEFHLWKQGGIGPGDTFGKASFFARPEAVVRVGLSKVHLETPAVEDRWTYMLEVEQVKDRDAYTSDKILVYAQLGDVSKQPFLLLAILEPGHSFMKQPVLVKGLAVAYETERSDYCKTLADPSWVKAGFD
ncbi:type II toxin-antitoxin system YafO family toxin [uncultured Pseudomonas sp.]|uniref:type II toxin-antitoxin system YafO family toxin n=1 Tax=uncultured Pseudomonas sp. TaxID=114707 RepID=UPI00258E1483|nr:type II toxin-antitoxin system YafO family toxin [uncultured Pseudomonas sp.]